MVIVSLQLCEVYSIAFQHHAFLHKNSRPKTSFKIKNAAGDPAIVYNTMPQSSLNIVLKKQQSSEKLCGDGTESRRGPCVHI